MKYQQELLKRLLTQFPKASSLTLARMAYKEAPSLFSSVENARTSVRYYRGAKGNKDRGRMVDRSFFRAEPTSKDAFSKITPGLTHFDKWGSVQMDGPMKVLVIADLHIPYHDRESIILALKYGKEHGANTILLNGDIADCFACSFWEKDPRKRDFVGEVEAVRGFLKEVRAGFPKARIIYKIGNHEERYERYMSCKAPELLGLPDFSFKEVFRLDQNKIEMVSEKRPIRLGKLNVIHGHEFKFGITSPVNPARGYFLRAKAHCLGSHLHQPSQHSEKDITGHVISTWSTGCLCDLHPDYQPIGNWSLGFAFVEVSKDGAFQVTNNRIIDGSIY